jgi:hypothetical protein
MSEQDEYTEESWTACVTKSTKFAESGHDEEIVCEIHDKQLVELEDLVFDMRGKTNDSEFETAISGSVWEVGEGSIYQCPRCIAYLYYKEPPNNHWGESLSNMSKGLAAYCFEMWAAGEMWQDIEGQAFVEVEQ